MTTAFDAKSSAADSSAHVTSQDSADTCPPIAVLPRTMTPISVTTISIVRRPRDASRARRAAALRLAVVIGPAPAPEARDGAAPSEGQAPSPAAPAQASAARTARRTSPALNRETVGEGKGG